MFENQTQPVLEKRDFFARMLRSIGLAIGMILFSLFIGMLGYHGFEGQNWVDAFANASMILSGMGPLSTLQTDGGKIFAGCYAIFSGLALVTVVATVLAPLLHRFLHRFHYDDEDNEDDLKKDA